MIRLNKYLSAAGICSRREADRLIESGHVTVDGKRAVPGMQVSEDQIVKVGKKTVHTGNERIVLAVNKPVGIICTEDRRTKNNIIRFLDYPQRITYAGRLDKDSEGLLLLTNDGAFANALTHPRHAYSKKYRVTIRGKVDDSALLQLREGIDLDGRMTAPCDVTVLTAEENRTVLEFVLHEGRNRQIRRMCEAVELEVIRLKRIAVGSLKLGMLPVGKWRELTDNEVQKLMRSGALQTEDTKK